MGKDIIFWAAAHILIGGLMPSAENLAIITTVALLILWIASAARRKGATVRPAVASEVPYRNETGSYISLDEVRARNIRLYGTAVRKPYHWQADTFANKER